MKSLFSKEKWQQLFYTVSHPSDGFYWIRHGEKGSVAIAILMVVLFGLCFTLNRLLAGFVVNDINERTVNALWEMSGVLMLYPKTDTYPAMPATAFSRFHPASTLLLA